MPQTRLRLATVFSVLALTGLGACATRLQPKPSGAVLEMRAQASAARTAAPTASTCPTAEAPPADQVLVVFPFLEAKPDAQTRVQLSDLARRLHCPGASLLLTAQADNHGTAAEQKALIAGRISTTQDLLAAAGVTGAQYVSAPAAVGTLTVLARGRDW